MIALVIIGILAAIAIPQYEQYKLKTRRSVAMGSLENFANAMERYYSINNSYLGAGTVVSTGGDANSAGAPAASVFPSVSPATGDAYYNLTIQPDVTSSTFTLRATPIAGGAQQNDGYLELQSTGARGWDRNNDGDTADTDENHW